MAHLATFSGQSSAALTATCSCVIPAGATYCTLMVGMRGSDGGATTLSSATLGAQAFTLNSTTMRRFDSFQAMQSGYILAADMPSGTLTATATRSTATNGMAISVSFFDGAVQAAPTIQLAGNGAGGDPFNTSITLSNASMLVDGIMTSSDSVTFTANQTDQTGRTAENVSGQSVSLFSSTRPVSSGSQTMGWGTSGNAQRTSHIVLALENAAAGPSISTTTDPVVDGVESSITASGLTGTPTTTLGGYSITTSGTLPDLTYTLDIASITADGPTSVPRIGDSLTLSVTADEGEATATVNTSPASGYAVVTMAGTLRTEANGLIDKTEAEGFTVEVGDIFYYPTDNSTNITEAGFLTTDYETLPLILIQGGDADTAGSAYAFSITPLAEADPPDPIGPGDWPFSKGIKPAAPETWTWGRRHPKTGMRVRMYKDG